MDSQHRIDPISINPTVPRQTPHDEFGQRIADNLGAGLHFGTGILQGITGIPALSAGVTSPGAVTSFSNALASPQRVSSSVAHVPGSASVVARAPVSAENAVAVSGGPWDLLEAQRTMQDQNQSFNLQYLQIQDQMQKESREFTTVSNIMKVRSDSAKAAINNIH